MKRLHKLPRFVTAALGVLALSLTTPVQAQLVGLSSSNPGTLYQFNTSTGVATPVFNLTGTVRVSYTDLAFLNGAFYATDLVFPGRDGYNFGTINATTGATTFISHQDGSNDWEGLTLNPKTGLFFTVDDDAPGEPLKTISPTGVTTIIGKTAAIFGKTAATFNCALAYDTLTQLLYDVDLNGNLYTLNTTTGAATLVGSLGLESFPYGYQGLAFDAASNTLFFTEGDTFHSLYTLNLATGAATLIGAYKTKTPIDGLTFLASSTVPDPGTYALLASLGLSGVVFLRCRRAR